MTKQSKDDLWIDDAVTQSRSDFESMTQMGGVEDRRSGWCSVPPRWRNQYYPIIEIEERPEMPLTNAPPLTPMITNPDPNLTYDEARAEDTDLSQSELRQVMLKYLQECSEEELEDINHAMAQVGTFRDCNPILRGLGPIEPCGMLPCGVSFGY